MFGLIYPYGLVLQALALAHFARRRPETYWLWIIIMGGGLGALVYLVVEAIPDFGLLRTSFQAFPRRKRIRALQLEIIDNPSPGNYEELGDLYLEDGQHAKARECYDRVLAGRATSLDPFYRRGLAALGLGDEEAARADLERVVAQDPRYDYHRAAGLLAHLCGRQGQAERADALFRGALALSTSSETQYNYAAFLFEHGRPAEAGEWARRLLAKKPTMPRYLKRQERPWFRRAKALLAKLPK